MHTCNQNNSIDPTQPKTGSSAADRTDGIQLLKISRAPESDTTPSSFATNNKKHKKNKKTRTVWFRLAVVAVAALSAVPAPLVSGGTPRAIVVVTVPLVGLSRRCCCRGKENKTQRENTYKTQSPTHKGQRKGRRARARGLRGQQGRHSHDIYVLFVHVSTVNTKQGGERREERRK